MRKTPVVLIFCAIILAWTPCLYAANVIVNPLTRTVIRGNLVKVDIKVEDVQDLYGAQFNLDYNPDVLELKEIKEGDFLSQNGNDNTYFLEPKKSPGLIKEAAICRMIPQGLGVTGEGTVAELTFRAKSEGVSTINLTGVKLASSKAEPIGFKAIGSSIGVSTGGVGGVIPPGEEPEEEVPGKKEEAPEQVKEPEVPKTEPGPVITRTEAPTVTPEHRREVTTPARGVVEREAPYTRAIRTPLSAVPPVITRRAEPVTSQIKPEEEKITQQEAAAIEKGKRADQISSIAKGLSTIEKPERVKEVAVKEEKIARTPKKKPDLVIFSLLGLAGIPIPWTIKKIRWYW